MRRRRARRRPRARAAANGICYGWRRGGAGRRAAAAVRRGRGPAGLPGGVAGDCGCQAACGVYQIRHGAGASGAGVLGGAGFPSRQAAGGWTPRRRRAGALSLACCPHGCSSFAVLMQLGAGPHTCTRVTGSCRTHGSRASITSTIKFSGHAVSCTMQDMGFRGLLPPSAHRAGDTGVGSECTSYPSSGTGILSEGRHFVARRCRLTGAATAWTASACCRRWGSFLLSSPASGGQTLRSAMKLRGSAMKPQAADLGGWWGSLTGQTAYTCICPCPCDCLVQHALY